MAFVAKAPHSSVVISGCVAFTGVLCSSVYLTVRAHQKAKYENTRSAIRAQLPPDLLSWRSPLDKEGNVNAAVWDRLSDFFQSRGYTFWTRAPRIFCQDWPGVVSMHGFGYAPAHEGFDEDSGFDDLHHFDYPTHAVHAANTADGRAVVLRVLAVGDEGRTHVSILEFIASTYHATASRNHALPLLEVIHFDDITFGVFPKVGQDLRQLFWPIRKNSVGDILDILMQCLEALDYIHGENIAHRDAYKENFLLQYYPHSLVKEPLRTTRPRVFLLDFEVAVGFADLPREKHLCVGASHGGTVPMTTDFNGRVSPEVLTGEPYCPYKLDVWQLGKSFVDFKSTIHSIDEVLERMRDPKLSLRLTASDAQRQLAKIVAATYPRDLLIPPDYSAFPPSILNLGNRELYV